MDITNENPFGRDTLTFDKILDKRDKRSSATYEAVILKRKSKESLNISDEE